MQAAEAKLQKVLEGSKQFLVPHYQRPYSWTSPQWQGLWTDILDLVADDDPQPHFLGSIVTAPARTVPEGVEKRLLIDGQQRLTTLVVLLALVRDRARDAENVKLAEKLQDLVANRHDEGVDRFKLLPTQGEDPQESDRDAFTKIVAGMDNTVKSGISDAYAWFAARLSRPGAPDLDHLARVISGKLTLVSIVLDDNDNPHRIFESLNGKGRPLSQADLIRNYFFMRLPVTEHEAVYTELWRPMQRRLGEENLTEFVRHYLMKAGQFVREMDVYSFLKARVDHDGGRKPIEHLRELRRFADLYALLLDAGKCEHLGLRERFARLARLEVTVAYPLLLGVLDDHASGRLDVEQACDVLDVLENFLIRRFVCGVPTHGLNKLLTPLYAQASKAPDFVAAVKKAMSSSANAYPRDEQFRERLMSARLYGGGERREKTKYILERLETAMGHKERVDLKPLTIEHVMPQTMTPGWKEALGPEWESEHEELLHTLGNLTLTSYNAELGNASYAAKRAFYADSHVELNDYFATVDAWTSEAIEERAANLAELAFTVWPSFGASAPSVDEARAPAASVTGTTPKSITVRGKTRAVKSWVDVAIETVEAVIQGGEEEFAQIAAELPKFVNHDATAFRRSSRLRRLSNGAYIETNLSAAHIHRLSLQVATLAGLSASDSREASPRRGRAIGWTSRSAGAACG